MSTKPSTLNPQPLPDVIAATWRRSADICLLPEVSMLAKECMELSETSFQVIIRGGFSPKFAKTLEPLSEDRKSLNLLLLSITDCGCFSPKARFSHRKGNPKNGCGGQLVSTSCLCASMTLFYTQSDFCYSHLHLTTLRPFASLRLFQHS